MANAKRDSNGVPTLIAALKTNGTTPMLLKASATTGALQTTNGSGNSYVGRSTAIRDENGVHAMTAVSSVNGTTIVSLQADASGNLLIYS